MHHDDPFKFGLPGPIYPEPSDPSRRPAEPEPSRAPLAPQPPVDRRPRAFSSCSEHLEEGLLHVTGRTVRVRQVNDPRTFKCKDGCDRPATWYLAEVK